MDPLLSVALLLAVLVFGETLVARDVAAKAGVSFSKLLLLTGGRTGLRLAGAGGGALFAVPHVFSSTLPEAAALAALAAAILAGGQIGRLLADALFSLPAAIGLRQAERALEVERMRRKGYVPSSPMRKAGSEQAPA